MQISPETALEQATEHHLSGRYELARDLYEYVIDVNPDSARAHMNLGMLLLLHGDFEAGWREFSWRRHGQPGQLAAWDGRPLTGEGVLIRGEQGAGDNIQFLRYVPVIKRAGGRPAVLTRPGMKRLIQSFDADLAVFEPGEQVSDLAFEVAVMDLPGLSKTTLSTIPAEVPYMSAEPGLMAEWGNRLGPPAGRRIGLCWQGNPDKPRDKLRSIPLTDFAPLIETPGTEWYGLQVGPGEEQVPGFRHIGKFTHLGGRLGASSDHFVDAAAAMTELDLVITVDTAIAHLAGALARPVWILLPHNPDWRWLLERDDSPWYPTARLFRQADAGDWSVPLAAIAAALRQ